MGQVTSKNILKNKEMLHVFSCNLETGFNPKFFGITVFSANVPTRSRGRWMKNQEGNNNNNHNSNINLLIGLI
jgi:hypothetical protein